VDEVPLPPGGSPEPPAGPLTAFQHAVVRVVRQLDHGEVLSYAEVAEEAGYPGSAQAVANVLRRVPGLPWWRVVPSTGRLYRTHAPVQRPLLESEGVEIDPAGRVATGRGDPCEEKRAGSGLEDQFG
jgi:methylated-DNA-protein-cysteine methyltransferase related protein